ncbi:serine carboxypeptidase-like 17 [Prunus dulcis]|uniref:Serine carboxypeptidase-like 17 n=1 Tax=Prunus dulcis TaxID=3755 RepID=A0A4Y1RZ46_PRUDU|nr:serine carboxypeptidase-like 17 [Prunus dulcis]
MTFPTEERKQERTMTKTNRSLRLLWLWKKSLLLLLLLPNFCSTQTIIKNLPGFSGDLPFKLETGYVGVGNKDELQLFYYFIESERSPENDPLLLWITGGPRCSSFSGLVYENGPISFSFTSITKHPVELVLNPYSWTKLANIIFLDAPAGTGFSYSTTTDGYNTSDTIHAKRASEFLQRWLLTHPKFLANPLYISGDSYSGKIVPIIVQEITNGIEAGIEPSLNLEGYIIGNPVTNRKEELNSQIEYAHRMALISTRMFESTKRNCKGDYVDVDPNNELCLINLQAFEECISRLEVSHILTPACAPGIDDDSFLSFPFPEQLCRVERQRGDHDLKVPHISTEAWIESLSLPIVDDWKPWFSNNQVAGSNRSLTICIRLLSLWRKALLLLLLLPNFCSTQTIIKNLPGFSGDLPFKLETGYVGVGNKDELQLFYYFIESERSPENDPLLLWITGGPRCSAFSGLVYEIDAPAGTGFSYSTTTDGYNTSDTIHAKRASEFLQKWLSTHRKFLANPLYISGDSYSGKIVPIIVQEIINGIEAATEPPLNLKGYIIGDPVTNEKEDMNSRIEFAHHMALISNRMYESTKRNCKGEYVDVDPNNQLCLNNLQAFKECTSRLDDSHILAPACVPRINHNEQTTFGWDWDSIDDNFLSFPFPESLCRVDRLRYSVVWANDMKVRKALNIREGTKGEWARCNRSTPYIKDVQRAVEYHRNLSQKSLRAFVYSGDHDLSVPYVSTEAWIESLSLPIDDDWKPWFSNNQIHCQGGGHTAPEFNPRECFDMIKRYVGVGGMDDVQLFYYFFESEGSPEYDPLVLWLTGGPDASVGTGFSYAKNWEGYSNPNDTLSAAQTYEFLRKWLMDHPKFYNNPLYIAGDSYSGITVPMLAQEISDGNQDEHVPPMNLKGYVLGNPVTDEKKDNNYKVLFAYLKALISDELYQSMKKNCKGEYINVDLNNTLCVEDLELYNESLEAMVRRRTGCSHIIVASKSTIDTLPAFPVCGVGDLDDVQLFYYFIESERSPKEDPLWILLCKKLARIRDPVILSSAAHTYEFLRKWLKDHPEFLKNPLYIAGDSYSGITVPIVVQEVSNGNNKGLGKMQIRAYLAIMHMIGDHDMLIPYVGTQEWIKSLNLSVDYQWRPWFVNGQVAGYTNAYTKNLQFDICDCKDVQLLDTI